MSCLFDSLLKAARLEREYANSLLLRYDLVQFVAQRPWQFKEHIDHLYGQSVDDYCRHMYKHDTQGDYVMLVAFSELFKCNVKVKMPSRIIHAVQSLDVNAPFVTIQWRPGHYFI